MVDSQISTAHAAVLARVVVARENRMPAQSELRHGALNHVAHFHDRWSLKWPKSGSNRFVMVVEDVSFLAHDQRESATNVADIQRLVITVQKQDFFQGDSLRCIELDRRKPTGPHAMANGPIRRTDKNARMIVSDQLVGRIR